MFCLNIHFSHNAHMLRCWLTEQLVFTLQLREVTKDTLRRILQQPGKMKVIPNCQVTPYSMWMCFINFPSHRQLWFLIGHIGQFLNSTKVGIFVKTSHFLFWAKYNLILWMTVKMATFKAHNIFKCVILHLQFLSDTVLTHTVGVCVLACTNCTEKHWCLVRAQKLLWFSCLQSLVFSCPTQACLLLLDPCVFLLMVFQNIKCDQAQV